MTYYIRKCTGENDRQPTAFRELSSAVETDRAPFAANETTTICTIHPGLEPPMEELLAAAREGGCQMAEALTACLICVFLVMP